MEPNIELIVSIVAIVFSVGTYFIKTRKKEYDKLRKMIDDEKEKNTARFVRLNDKGCNFVNALRVEMLEKFATVENINEMKELLVQLNRRL